MKLETERLLLRPMIQEDYPALAAMLQNPDVMRAYERDFSDADVQDWLDNQIKRRQQQDYLGLMSVILKSTGQMIGQAGLTMQDVEGDKVLEIGYIFNQDFWHHGYAREAAMALKDYAFNALKAPKVYSTIKTTNIPSQNVAKSLGMQIEKEYIKIYHGIVMPHYLFSCQRPDISESSDFDPGIPRK